jgi:hypothetical protein
MPNSKAFGLAIDLVLRHCSSFPKICFSSGDQATRQSGKRVRSAQVRGSGLDLELGLTFILP